MISIVKYLHEALTSGVPGPDEAASLHGKVARYLGNPLGAYTGGQVKGVRDNEAFAWSKKMLKQQSEHDEAMKKAEEAGALIAKNSPAVFEPEALQPLTGGKRSATAGTLSVTTFAIAR